MVYPFLQAESVPSLIQGWSILYLTIHDQFLTSLVVIIPLANIIFIVHSHIYQKETAMCQCQAHQAFVLQKLWLVLIQKGEQDHWHHDCQTRQVFSWQWR